MTMLLLHIEYIWIYKKLIIKCFTSFSSLSNLYPLLPFNGCIYCPFITINYCNFFKWLKTADRFSFILQNSQYYRTPSPITTHVDVLFDFLLFFCSTIDQPLINPNPISPQPHPRSNLLHLSQNYETDELMEEMAHLEGLMKDLNAITTAWAQSSQ